jgi:predicted phosphodiesterase
MRYLVLSDLHSNLEALRAVAAAAEGGYDQVVCCGDVVGYGPDPDAVVNWIRENAAVAVRGNHDKACAGLIEGEDFSEVARQGVHWTRAHLSAENLQYLRNLPQGPRDVADAFAILHGSPADEDEYVPTRTDAAGCFSFLRHRISFFGHTHLQGGFVRRGLQITEVSPKVVPEGKSRGILEIQAREQYLLNPGSVGQPRDRDDRAAFAIFDTEGLVEYRRVAYDYETTMKKILDAGLPEFLAYRLSIGR